MAASPLVFSTTTPVRTPINMQSESLSEDLKQAKLSLPLTGKSFDLLLSQQLLPDSLNWKYGYGNLDRDAIPETFQPILKRVVNLDDDHAVMEDIIKFTDKRGLKLQCAELYCFDNTLGLLRIDFALSSDTLDSTALQRLDLSTIDQAFSVIAESIYQHVIYPNFLDALHPISSDLLGSAGRVQCKDPIYSDLDFKLRYNPEHLLWTGRCLQVCSSSLSENAKNQFMTWANCAEKVFFNTGAFQMFIGSGNYLVFSDNIDTVAKDVFRATAIAQIYSAFMTIYGGVFKSTLRDLLKLEQKKGFKARMTDSLLTQTARRLELLNFLKLDFAEATRSIQGNRKELVDNFIASWQINELEKTTCERANFIRSRLERITEERKISQNRTIEMILVSIGGVAVIDFALNMSGNAAKLKNDNILGLVDLFRWLSPDVSLWSACALVVMATVYVYHGKK
ncbi:hypothetical protein [Psychromonas antarctica]|jgi:hypothetical protein|uniref:hypothetical protein n=1 Tax=Psychromonas antarctica TaxID=67573 RepID=UPI001EE81764|nr:hypothetical protein [Psychromonas antarctica]MCG6201083.1 hypothetical protein [Psychromonas antarctica]